MLDTILTLVFSIVMLVFMAFPAMKIVEVIDKKIHINNKWYNAILIFTTVLLSLLVGLFLRFY